ncbi:MAG TPA: hypothetical protein EYH32_10515 [Anaerolineae bacterium]|nr:hypothetical protein [Anaerolineae bacterium]
MDERANLLVQTGQALIQAAAAGTFGGKPISIIRAETISGPRAGSVDLYAGVQTGILARTLAADNAALAAQFIAWPFPPNSQLAVYLAGRAVRLEAPWPPQLAQSSIRLENIAQNPKGDGRWAAGINEYGQTVIVGLDDHIPHWLYAGTTGSGKTVGLYSAALQLCRQPNNRLALIDGKWGGGLGPLVNLPGTVGPLATDVPSARAALAWVNKELQQRYQVIASRGPQAAEQFPRLIVIFDEFQEFVDDPPIRECLRRILSKGRAARIHALLATQHPTRASFGDDATMKRNLVGRMALKVTDAKASEVALGDSFPRADRLLGAGDAYVKGPQAIHRTQLVLVDERDLDEVERQNPILETWPEVKAEDLGQEPTVRWAYTGEELAYGLVMAWRGWGRTRLEKALEWAGLGRPGAERGIRLLRLAREQMAALHKLGLTLSVGHPRSPDEPDAADSLPSGQSA